MINLINISECFIKTIKDGQNLKKNTIDYLKLIKLNTYYIYRKFN